MRVLVLANAFPTPERPAFGSYVARGAETLASLGHEVRVVALGPGRRGTLVTPLASTAPLPRLSPGTPR